MNEFADFLEVSFWLLIAVGVVGAAMVLAGINRLLLKKGERNAD